MDNVQATVSLTETLCLEVRAPSCGIVIFGASGDLTARKLLPSLFSLFTRGLLPENFFVLGYARTPLGTDGFREQARKALREKFHPPDDELAEFCKLLHYLPGDYADAALYAELSRNLRKLDADYDAGGRLVFYLSTPPKVYDTVVARLADAGLLHEPDGGRGWRRVVVEKPFGHDLESARALDERLHRHLQERQIYRIDHYLGKETVQNVLMLRFANTVFEPVWNRHYVDHVQITAAEDIGIEHRAGYYDGTGLLRDMFQNHMLQLLCLVAMEPPAAFDADSLRDEKLKLLRSVRPLAADDVRKQVVRAQYTGGRIGDKDVAGYRQEKNIPDDSLTETLAAAEFFIDNWRWRGVPFYLRSGKRMHRRLTEIAVVFKRVPHSIFTPIAAPDLQPDMLVMNVQPHEGMALSLQAKQPGPKLCLGTLEMAMNYRDLFAGEQPDAYERLLLDIMLGDQTLFVRHDNVEMEWRILAPILDDWRKEDAEGHTGLKFYPAGSWGPPEVAELMTGNGRTWHNPPPGRRR